mgnify:CR=1 FL=1
MAMKTVDSDLEVRGVLNFNSTKNIQINNLNPNGGIYSYFYLGTWAEYYMMRIKDFVTLETGYVRYMMNDACLWSFCEDNKCHVELGKKGLPWVAVYSKKFIVPDGTNKQFLKADGSLDSTEYATVAELTTAQNNAWKLSEANAEVESVVLQLTNKGIFETMTAAEINPLTSRNIYVDLSKAESTLDIFAGYKDSPVGVRYHIFFGNTSQDVKLNWTEAEIESNIAGGTIGLTPAYPSAKCEFMRVTEAWTYADWEAKIENVSHVVDTGTASEIDNSTLVNFMDNNKIPYSKTANGGLVDITALLAALASGR